MANKSVQFITRNLSYTETDTEIVLTIPKNAELEPSKTGKMQMAVSTRGFVALPNGFRLNMSLGQ